MHKKLVHNSEIYFFSIQALFILLPYICMQLSATKRGRLMLLMDKPCQWYTLMIVLYFRKKQSISPGTPISSFFMELWNGLIKSIPFSQISQAIKIQKSLRIKSRFFKSPIQFCYYASQESNFGNMVDKSMIVVFNPKIYFESDL